MCQGSADAAMAEKADTDNERSEEKPKVEATVREAGPFRTVLPQVRTQLTPC